MANNRLSKSTFIRGLQCEKSLFLYKHHYRLKDPTPASLQAVFDRGTNVGLLAQELFPFGVDASPENHFKMVESVNKTSKYIDQGETIIYEATFMYNNVLAALDILVKDAEGWKAYEVKSSTKVSDTYVKDAAIQYYTIVNSGIDLKDISIVHINKQYKRDGELDIQQLFSTESVKDKVLEFLPQIPNEVNRLKNVISNSTTPNIKIGPHCFEPYACDYKGTCWKHIPDYSVFDISNLSTKKKFELYNQGIITLDQIDLDNTSLTPNQALQVQSEVEGTSFIDIDQIRNFISNLNYPLYYLDFETISPAVPIYNNSRPYQQLVFQYSLHIQSSPGSEIAHKEYLADPKQDPRIGFVEQLITECGTYGDIIVYNIGFEKGKLKDLIELFPQYSTQLTDIINRLKDLMIPFQHKWYYTPMMKGSYSIKYVLPALVPKLSYNNLEIKEGETASNTFLSMANGTFKGNPEKTRKQLLEYCRLDTLAMVKVIERLKAV
ncbi:MAG: DUF2779 domain-containing protein [Lentimicrobiaceae bacterium]|nr:DUF2779 domain-containing protein [Lentimicrobiaceae bacterium]